MSVLNVIKKCFNSLADLIWLPHCVICGARTEGLPICTECETEMQLDMRPHCPECGAINSKKCPRHPEPIFDCYYPLFVFGDSIRELIHGLKYADRVDIGEFLGKKLGEKMRNTKVFDDVDYFIPVPLHAVKKRERGYNQSEIIASSLREITGIPIMNDAVERIHRTRSQTKLNREQRKDNVSMVFKLAIDVKDKNFVIIDDVITTGATVCELARTIIGGGGKVSCALAIAHPDELQSKEFSI